MIERQKRANKHFWIIGGFQLEFVSISRVINHMTCYKFSAFIGCNYSIQTGDFFLEINFPPMTALEFITGHVIYNLAYTYKFQLKTTIVLKKSR